MSNRHQRGPARGIINALSLAVLFNGAILLLLRGAL